MIIRPETPADIPAISAVTLAAFRDHPHSEQTEHLIIERLRERGVLALSLVAEIQDEIVGHIAFSPIELSDGAQDWFGLGPLSVKPSRQGRGIGGALIRKGLEMLKARGATGCVVMGDPDLYRKFGFQNNARIIYADCAPQYFLAQALSPAGGSGMVTYDKAFDANLDG